MTRLEANLEILKLLEHYIKENPEQRFGQAINNLFSVGFYDESTETLKQLEYSLEKFKLNKEQSEHGW